MNTSHSSLEAYPDLSEAVLDRLGVVCVRRGDDPHARVGRRPGTNDPDQGTLAPFENMEWYEDPDVKRWLPRQQEWWGSK